MAAIDDAQHDSAHWDARYAAAERLWAATPNVTVAEVAGPMQPGRALDLGAGEGRHAVWLAALGWQVTAVDFSSTGLERGRRRAAEEGLTVDWQVADVLDWNPPQGARYDLVLVAYLHLERDAIGRARDWLAPGGRLVVVGHALRNLTDGVGGPSDPRLLHTPEQLAEAASGLAVERLEEVLRPTEAGKAIDLLLVARAPSS